jgi:hypothetical protein
MAPPVTVMMTTIISVMVKRNQTTTQQQHGDTIIVDCDCDDYFRKQQPKQDKPDFEIVLTTQAKKEIQTIWKKIVTTSSQNVSFGCHFYEILLQIMDIKAIS